MLLIFKTQPKIKPYVQNFEISKFELFALKIQKCFILFFWDLGHYLGPKIQQIDHWGQNLCQNPDHRECQILQLDAYRWFEWRNTACFWASGISPFKSPKSRLFHSWKQWKLLSFMKAVNFSRIQRMVKCDNQQSSSCAPIHDYSYLQIQASHVKTNNAFLMRFCMIHVLYFRHDHVNPQNCPH